MESRCLGIIGLRAAWIERDEIVDVVGGDRVRLPVLYVLIVARWLEDHAIDQAARYDRTLVRRRFIYNGDVRLEFV